MNESELRDGLRTVIAGSTPPPSMDAQAALAAARQVHRRRRATLAGIGAVAAVVAIAVGGTVALSSGGGGSSVQDLNPGAPGDLPGGSAGQPSALPTAGTEQPPNGDTRQPWPTGPDGKPQQDRTAYAGPRHELGVTLLDELIAVVPAGYTVPDVTPTPPDDNIAPEELNPSNDVWARYHQAQFVDRIGGQEAWEYLASVAVLQGGSAGQLFVQVHAAPNALPGQPCEAAVTLWGLGGQCQVHDVDGKQVGVVAKAGDPQREAFDQWASYRHPDGTVVFVAQAQKYRGTGVVPLPAPLFTVDQLARLATDERFHLR
jgi:hypothetical protein